MNNNTTLIIGANGTVGQEIVGLLKSSGNKIRMATSRNVSNQDQVYLNLVTGEGLSSALDGADQVFLLSPPGHADQYLLLSPVIKEAQKRKLKKVVMMTAMGANANAESPFRRAEIDLEQSGLNYNILRPNWFMQNFHTFWIQGIQSQNKILLPAGQAKVSFVDARDIAAVATQLLTSNKNDNKAFDLTGSEALDHQQVAEAITEVAGRRILYHEISESEFFESLIASGVPKGYAQFLVLIIGFLRQGYSERQTLAIEEILGRKPRSFKNYLNDYKTKFI